MQTSQKKVNLNSTPSGAGERKKANIHTTKGMPENSQEMNFVVDVKFLVGLVESILDQRFLIHPDALASAPPPPPVDDSHHLLKAQ